MASEAAQQAEAIAEGPDPFISCTPSVQAEVLMFTLKARITNGPAGPTHAAAVVTPPSVVKHHVRVQHMVQAVALTVPAI